MSASSAARPRLLTQLDGIVEISLEAFALPVSRFHLGHAGPQFWHNS